MNVLTAKYQKIGETLRISLSGEIDHHSVRALREEIDAKITELRPRELILDLSRIGFMDSSGLGLILGRYNKMKAVGGHLKISDPGSGALRVLKLSAADTLIPIEWTEENNK